MKDIRIASVIVQRRREKGITQEELAEYIGVSKASVSKWETGQSYPDITFLPQLAAYFGISIDALMGYTPQMTPQEIRKLYIRLADAFACGPFADALAECRSAVKKYYACFPLLYRMALLLVNHHMLAETTQEKEGILREAARLCHRVRGESDDVWLIKDAAYIQALCAMMLKEPQDVLELLGETVRPHMQEEMLIAQAFHLLGNRQKARETVQTSVYQHAMSLLDALLNYARMEDDTQNADEALDRVQALARIFRLDTLNPSMAVSLYSTGAFLQCARSRLDEAADMLAKYVDICTEGFFPLKLHGDDFFNAMETWLEEATLGIGAPRSEKVIKESMLNDVLLNPVFAALRGDARYERAVKRLTDYVKREE